MNLGSYTSNLELRSVSLQAQNVLHFVTSEQTEDALYTFQVVDGGALLVGKDTVYGETPTQVNPTTFLLGPFEPGTTRVYINGVRVYDYIENVSNYTIVFGTAPSLGTIIADYDPPGLTGIANYAEIMAGIINGSNTVFTTAENFESDTTRPYLNGIRLESPESYTETGANEITLTAAPLVGADLRIDYDLEVV